MAVQTATNSPSFSSRVGDFSLSGVKIGVKIIYFYNTLNLTFLFFVQFHKHFI